MAQEITNLALRRGLKQIIGARQILTEGKVVSSNTSCTSFRIRFTVFGNRKTLKLRTFNYNAKLLVYWTNVECSLVENKSGAKSEKKTLITLYWRASNNLEPCHI